jgi:hypothetical protein
MAAMSTSAAPAAKTPTADQYVGKWVGKWDGKWPVEFTFSRDPKTKELLVIYAHAEHVGDPLEAEEKSYAGFKDGVVLVGDSIEVSLSTADPNIATAKGHFKKPRIAVLARDFSAKKAKD